MFQIFARTTYGLPHHHPSSPVLFHEVTSVCTMTLAAFATNETVTVMESQPKRYFRGLLKSSGTLLVGGRAILLGRGLPSGPTFGVAGGVAGADALEMSILLVVKTAKKKNKSRMGYV